MAYYYVIFLLACIVLNRIVYGLSKKKIPYLHLVDEAIGLLNTEIRLIEWRIKYPEQLQQRTNKQSLSPLFLADKTTLINIMEMVSGLFLSKDIVYQNGKPAYLVDLSKGFEWLFNIKISDCHQKHEDVIKRKPGKLTEFLNGLADLIRKEHDHLIGKQSRIFEEQRFRLQLRCPVDRRKLFRQFLPGKSQILRSIVVAPYANNVFVHLFS